MKAIQRLKQYIDKQGFNNSSFEKKNKLSNGYIGTQIKRNADLGEGVLNKILDYCLELNPEWLLTGKGEMLKSIVPAIPANNAKGIPLLPFEAFAGVGFDAEGVNFDVIEERYEIPLFEGIKVDFMLPVRGSSMYPKYSSGDVVACRLIKEITFFQWNKVYVIDTHNQGIIMKRIKKSSNEDVIICKSDNENYEPFEMPKDEIRNIALVVGVIRLE